MEGRKSGEVGNLINKAYADRRLGDLIADGDKVRELTEHPGWALLQGILDALGEQALADLDASLKPQDQAVYVQRHSYRNGLRMVANAAHTFVAKAQEATAEIERHDAELASERT